MSLADMFCEEGKKLGKEEGKKEMKEIFVKNAIEKGLNLRIIEEITGLSQEEIQKIASNLNE
ncbi:hypothetical protein [Oceanobacillus sp. AG]|uniref:hypothetical protein n=1 Tax=Oceanobacillus sp. AG TaxID=2681969 RepID=UPI0012EC4A92|nr:hypothetical protein [Oceanobacillus sp. AG]